MNVRLRAALLLAALVCASLHPRQASAQAYRFTDIGTLNGGYTVAYSINDSGQIAGSSNHSSGYLRAIRIDPTTVNGQQTWFVDNGASGNAQMSLLGLPGKTYHWSLGRAINAFGQVTGTSQGSVSSLPESATIWSQLGVAQVLTTSKVKSEGFGISNTGAVSGVIYGATNSGTVWSLVAGNYTATTIQPISPYNGATGFGLNNLDQSSGALYTAGSPGDAFLWLPKMFYGSPPMPAGTNVLPSGFKSIGNEGAPSINDGGIVSGYVGGNNAALWKAALWLPAGAGAAYGLADGVNNIHDATSIFVTSMATAVNTPASAQPLVVVGWGKDSLGNAYGWVWDSTTRKMRNLSDPAVTPNLPPGWIVKEARGINTNGQIVGTGTYNGVTRGFVLAP